MSDRRIFVDTNVLVYLRDSRWPERQRQPAEWAGHLWEARVGRLSVQVLHAARAQDCSLLLTEDLSHGQDLDGVRVVSPFLENP